MSGPLHRYIELLCNYILYHTVRLQNTFFSFCEIQIMCTVQLHHLITWLLYKS